MPFSIIYGAKMSRAPLCLGNEGWMGLAVEYNVAHNTEACGERLILASPVEWHWTEQLLGFVVAHGGKCDRGCAALGTLPLADILSVPACKDRYLSAIDGWANLIKWTNKEGPILAAHMTSDDEPRLWIVGETEQ